MKIEVLNYNESKEKYIVFLKKLYKPLAQHSWEWQTLLSNWSGIEWKMICVLDENEDILACINFCVKENHIGKVMMSSPLPASYGGVLHIKEDHKAEYYEKLLDTWIKYGIRNNIDIISIFTSPFRDDKDIYCDFFKPDYIFEKFYQYIPVSSDKNDYISHANRNLKRNIKKYDASDIQVIIEKYPNKDILKQWYDEILTNRFNEINAILMPFELIFNLVEAFKDSDQLEFIGLVKNKKLISGGIVLYGWCQDIYLRATTSEELKRGSGVYFDNIIFQRASDRNCRFINFQSSPNRLSNSYNYKKQWGCEENNTYYLTKVLTNKEKFLNLGVEEITKSFEHFFVLPFNIF